MSYIEPNTDIYLLEGVPLDPDYENTIFFPLIVGGEFTTFDKENYERATGNDIVASRRYQKDYFLSEINYPHFVFQRQSYQRINNNIINVHKNAESLYRVNYLVFRNINFQDTTESVLNERWIYAFVKQINYVNNNVAEIVYDIDVMQTWWFDYFPNMCYVEREHTLTDGLFEHIEPENVDLGSQYVVNSTAFFSMNQMKLCMLVNRNLAGESPQLTPPSSLINNIYTPVRVYENFDVNLANIKNIDSYINTLNENDIITIYQYPAVLQKRTFPDIVIDMPMGLPANADNFIFKSIGVIPQVNEMVGYQICFGSDQNVYTITSNDATRAYIQPATSVGAPNGTPVYALNDPVAPVNPPTQLITMNTDIDGYTPKNKKLLSYPYNKLIVSNNCGSTGEYKWEFLGLNSSNQATFYIDGSYVPSPMSLCYPSRYRGVYNDFDSGISYGNFPTCGWSGDTFKTWWSQNKASFVTSTMASVISSVMANVTGTMFNNALLMNAQGGGLASALSAERFANARQFSINAQTGLGVGSSVAGNIAKMVDIANMPSQTHGQLQSDSLNSALQRVGYTFYNASICQQAARIIDDYFTRFGYACRRTKYPNRLVRSEWTYVKTLGCTLGHAKLPADDEKRICDIYNKGITFWVNGLHIGDYSFNNQTLTTPGG